MAIKMLAQASGALLKLSYVAGMCWLYASRPAVLAASLVMLSVMAVLAATARLRH